MYRNILVPIDSEGLSDRALEHAIGLSGALGSRLTLMTVAADAHVTHEASSSEVPPSRSARMFHRAAGRLYERNGFTLTSRTEGEAFGQKVVDQTWERPLTDG